MFVYGNFPVVNTDVLIRTLSVHSEDPIRKVVCIAYDKETKLVTAFGVNKVVHHLKHHSQVRVAVGTPEHPAKKFLMIHSEMDLIKKMSDSPSHVIQNTGIFLSLQPCMDCLKSLIHAGFTTIEWKEDNRHQHEQEIMKPFLNIMKYRKNEEGLFLQVPTWIANEQELNKNK